MNNTALRAEAQSANNTHMVFANEEHEKFYYEKLEQARYQDCYHKALIYILGISEDTRNHFSQIYDMKSGFIKPECLHQGWQTSGSVRVVRLFLISCLGVPFCMYGGYSNFFWLLCYKQKFVVFVPISQKLQKHIRKDGRNTNFLAYQLIYFSV